LIFIIDEDLPRSMTNALNEKGFKAYDVRDIGLRGTGDKEIFAEACRRKAILITSDIGFASLVYLSSMNHYGLILLRLPNDYSITNTNSLVLKIVTSLDNDEISGNIVVITPHRVRIRKKKRK